MILPSLRLDALQLSLNITKYCPRTMYKIQQIYNRLSHYIQNVIAREESTSY